VDPNWINETERQLLSELELEALALVDVRGAGRSSQLGGALLGAFRT